jgi:hypothetical protein
VKNEGACLPNRPFERDTNHPALTADGLRRFDSLVGLAEMRGKGEASNKNDLNFTPEGGGGNLTPGVADRLADRLFRFV